jgi:hypothetical protein
MTMRCTWLVPSQSWVVQDPSTPLPADLPVLAGPSHRRDTPRRHGVLFRAARDVHATEPAEVRGRPEARLHDVPGEMRPRLRARSTASRRELAPSLV